MSAIINLLTDKFSILASDKRLVKFTYNNNMDVISTDIINENTSKIKRINKKVNIAFCGDPIPSMNSFSSLKGYDLENLTLERIKRIYINELKQQQIGNNGVKIIISGRNKNNLLTTYVISSKNDFIEEFYQPKANELCRVYALPTEKDSNGDNLGEILDCLVKSSLPFTSLEDAEKLAQKCVLKIADRNMTVNHNIQMEVIQ